MLDENVKTASAIRPMLMAKVAAARAHATAFREAMAHAMGRAMPNVCRRKWVFGIVPDAARTA